MAFTYALDPATPAGTDLVSQGDNSIREFKQAVIERINSFFVSVDTNPLTPKAASVPNNATTGVATNTPSTLVLRDASGNFAAGVVTASLTGNVTGNVTGNMTGNASTATALQTARTINGTSFDGTANITISAAAGTLSGTTLASNVVSSSLTSVGTLATLSVTAAIVGSVTGNAGTATILQTARTINGVSFDGSANITISTAAAAGTLTGTTLAANVVTSSLTSTDALTMPGLTVTNGASSVLVTFGNSVNASSAITRYLVGATKYAWQVGAQQIVDNGLEWTPSTAVGGTTFTTPVMTLTQAGVLTVASVVGALTGNASTATVLQTARTINGVSFNGSANITISAAADAGLLTGTTLAANVVSSSLTSVGTLGSLTVTGAAALNGGITSTYVTAGAFLTANTSTTNQKYIQISNASNTVNFGIESSVGGTIGGLAYYGVLSSTSQPFQMVMGTSTGLTTFSSAGVTMSGTLGVTGTAVFDGKISQTQSSEYVTYGPVGRVNLTNGGLDELIMTIVAGTPTTDPGKWVWGWTNGANGDATRYYQVKLGWNLTASSSLIDNALGGMALIFGQNAQVSPGVYGPTMSASYVKPGGAVAYLPFNWSANNSTGTVNWYHRGSDFLWRESLTGATMTELSTSGFWMTSAGASALSIGLNGSTNPAFNVDASTASQAAGLNVTGAVAAGTVAVAVISSGSNASVTFNAKGTGTLGIATVSTGAVTIGGASTTTTFPGAVTVSGTLTGSITGNAATATNVAASGITGTTLASNVVTSSLTAVGTLATLTTGGLVTITQGTTNTAALSSTGYSLTGSNTTSMVSLAGTVNTSGNPTIFSLAITQTAVGSTSTAKIFNFLAGASGTTSMLSLSFAGTLTCQGNIALGGGVTMNARGGINPGGSDGVVRVTNNGNTGLTRLSLGPDTTSFAAWSISGTAVSLTLGDGSAGGTLRMDGNLMIGAAAGASAVKVLALSNSATSPSASADLAHVYAKDIAAGQAVLAVYQEYAPYAGVGVASTHKIPVIYNDTAYYLLATTVQ